MLSIKKNNASNRNRFNEVQHVCFKIKKEKKTDSVS